MIYKEYKSLTEKIYAEIDKRNAMPLWRRIIYDTPRAITVVIPRIIKNVPYSIKSRLNFLIHGWSDIDWWEYASRNSERAVILLTKLKNKGHGIKLVSNNSSVQAVSFDGEGREEWESILDDMIFYHKVIAGQYEEQYKGHNIPVVHISMMTNLENKHRARKGAYYYYKYYDSLWD